MRKAGFVLGTLLTVVVAVSAAEPPPIYENDFQSAAVGKVPEGMLALESGFAVREEGDAKFLELPGSPLETYGVLFGPGLTNNMAVSARVHGTRKGRLFPAFGVGLGGVTGYKLQVSPGKKELELHKGDTDLISIPFNWQSGKWTHLRLQIRSAATGTATNLIEGKAWTEGEVEPANWLVAFEEKQAPKAGRAAIWGAPYSGTPIRYDDLRLVAVEPGK